MNTKTIINKNFSSYQISELETQMIQKVLMIILVDIRNSLVKRNITFFLSYGTCLGAIRHNGFIPWDDDIDILMLRKDLENIQVYLKEDYGDKYVVESIELQKKCPRKMTKVFLNGTKLSELESINWPVEQKVFLDIFCIENLPKSKLKRKFRSAIYRIAFLATGAIAFSKWPSPILLEKAKTNKEVNKLCRTKKFYGRLFRIFFGFNFWRRILLRVSKYKKDTGIYGVPSGGGRYLKEVYYSDDLKDPIWVDFCGEKMPVLKNYHHHLVTIFGKDYMTLPPVEKRERHLVSEYDLGKYSPKN